jgi:hypothetical protein
MKVYFWLIGVLMVFIFVICIQAKSPNLIKKEHQKMDTKKSEKLVKSYFDRKIKYNRKVHKFAVDVKTTVEDFFPLLCPSREADWIPGWDCDLIYTSDGYAEDKCVFTTDASNSVGEGIWTFTEFKKNEFIAFVRFQEDILTHCKITVSNNQDGTINATWNVTQTALSEEGNRIISNLTEKSSHSAGLEKMLTNYLQNKKGFLHKLH